MMIVVILSFNLYVYLPRLTKTNITVADFNIFSSIIVVVLLKKSLFNSRTIAISA